MAEVIVRAEKNYGHYAYYPVSEFALFLAEVSGKKTITPAVVEVCKRYGYPVIIEGSERREL